MNPYQKNFLQSANWAAANRLIGHQVIEQDGQLLIIKSARRGRYLEIPGGPLLDWQDQPAVTAFFENAKTIAREHNCAFIRFRPQLPNDKTSLEIIQKLGAEKAPMHLHAEHTVIIDLTQSEADIMKNLRRQTRYEVRRADKLGIRVAKSTTEATFHQFHQLQLETARRQHFIPPDQKTLLAYHQAFGDAAPIYTATNADDEVIAMGLILIGDTEAAYFEAASTPLGRSLPGAYALLWQVIKDLKAADIQRFNLWGIAPAGQPNHRYAGVTTFKTGFGPIVEFLPAQDIVINKTRYKFNCLIENYRKKRRHL